MKSALRIRSYASTDYEGLLAIQRACFPPPYPEEQLWSREQVEAHARIFPEGALCVEVGGGLLVASCTALIIDAAAWESRGHSWAEVSDNGFLSTHDPRGDTLYGIDVAVHPEWRGRGLARSMYEARMGLVIRLGLARFQAAGRMPGYGDVKHLMTPEDYVHEVATGRRADPVLTPQMRSGLQPVRVLRDYIPDEESADCALLLQWINPDSGNGAAS